MDEIEDPELGIDRMLEYYHRKGYSTNWVNQRLKSIEVRKELTDEWEQRGVQKGQEYATFIRSPMLFLSCQVGTKGRKNNFAYFAKRSE